MTEALSLTGVLSCVLASALVTISGVYGEDVASALGATAGAGIAVLEAWKSERTWRHSASVFVSSLVFGCAMPGLIIFFGYPEYQAKLTWHAWGIFGFVWALMGWAITVGILRMARAETFWGVFLKLIGRLFGVSTPPTEDPDKRKK